MYNHIRLRALGALFLLLAFFAIPFAGAGPVSTTGATAAALVDREKLGMVIRDPWYDFGTYPGAPNQPNRIAQDQMGATLARLGVRWVRLEFHLQDGDVEEQIARHDYFINQVAPRHNLKVLALLGFGVTRDWPPFDPVDPRSLIYPQTYTDPVYGGGVNNYMRTWLDRARTIADRYQGRIAAYEILNEQNRLTPNGDGIPATITARLHTKFYRFFRQVDRNAPGDQSWRDNVQIILGGLHPKGTFEPGEKDHISDEEYLQELYQSDGFVSYHDTYGHYPIDGLGYHPYPEEIRLSLQSELDLIRTRLDSIRLTLNSLDERHPPLWITEVGYNAGYLRQNESGQAAFLRATYTGLGTRNDVATIFWFKYEDFPPANGTNAQKWGVVRIPFTESASCPGGACYDITGEPTVLRPAFWVYRELAGLTVERRYLPIVGAQGN